VDWSTKFELPWTPHGREERLIKTPFPPALTLALARLFQPWNPWFQLPPHPPSYHLVVVHYISRSSKLQYRRSRVLVATISASNKYSAANTKGLTAAFLSVAKLPSDLSLFPSISNSNSKSTSVYLSCLHFPGDPDALWHPLHGSIILIFNMAVMAPYISIDPERGLRSTRVKRPYWPIPGNEITDQVSKLRSRSC
jgi:hypothetical protein